MKIRLVILLFVLVALGCTGTEPPTTFILLRHAEKGNDGTEDPDLKPEGIERAERITQMLKDTRIDGIYATDFKRTRQTVKPLGLAKNLEVQQYEAFREDEIENMLRKHRGGTVVVCGHTNNIPWTANLLIGREEFKDYDESQYGIFLMVTVVEKGRNAKVIRLNY